MYERHKSKGFEIVVVDALRDTENALKFIKENDLPYLFLEDGEGDKDIVQNVYKVFSFPTSFLLDHEGRVMYYHVGFAPGQEQKLEEELLTLLERPVKQAK